MQNWLEWMGYAASAIILVSLLMSSIIKLRIINTIGSTIFAVYGILIGSLPVAVMNFGIVAINAYYLIKIFSEKAPLSLVEMSPNSEYMTSFIDYYESDIKKFVRFNKAVLKDSVIAFLVLRDMQDAGAFICSEHDSETLKIDVDFVTPKYRDFSIGKYIYKDQKKLFLDKGYKRFIAESENDYHIKYLKKMGFSEFGDSGRLWVKEIG
jgi:hypothetical protein